MIGKKRKSDDDTGLMEEKMNKHTNERMNQPKKKRKKEKTNKQHKLYYNAVNKINVWLSSLAFFK